MVYDNPNIPWQPDESYWQALLTQGEFAEPVNSLSPSLYKPHQDGKTDRNPSRQTPWTQGKEEDWAQAEKDMAAYRILMLPVSGCNKGGVLVDYYSIQGFVPTSHLLNLPRLPDIEERLRVLSEKIGQTLRLRIIEIDRDRGRLILSERAAQEDERALRIWQSVRPGDILEGTVTRLESYGAFVDVGGVEGLVHVSELSWSRVDHPSEVVQPGDKVRVYVLGLKPNQRKIALSLKRLMPDPWENVENRFHVGDIVDGTVTHVVHFGAFVRIAEGLEGLIHVSQLAGNAWARPYEILQEGDTVRVQVQEVDGKNRRLALKLITVLPVDRSQLDSIEHT